MGPIPFFVVPNLKKSNTKLVCLANRTHFSKQKHRPQSNDLFKKVNLKSPNKLTLLCHLPLICLIPGVNQKL